MTTRTTKAAGGKAYRVMRLRLENWRNFRHVDAKLPMRVFLVGPNASGKSNALDVFRFLRDIVSVGGGFQEAVQSRGGVSRIRCLAARRQPEVVVEAEIGRTGPECVWRYELRFTQDNLRRPIIRKEVVAHNGNTLVERPDERDQGDPERLTQTYLEQVSMNRDFRELVTFFQSVRYLHIVPQLVREPERSVGRKNDPFGGDFLERIGATPEKTRNARFRRIERALRVAVPHLTEVEWFRDVRGTAHLRGKYSHWRPRGAWQKEDQFSDGTLRLLGLLWAVLDGDGPLLLEEPELSLHPEVVRHIPQMLARAQRPSGRQVILSTHSADLLQDEDIGMDEVLLLVPSPEGVGINAASDLLDAKALLEDGVTLSELVMQRTRPEVAEQLALFGD